MASKVTHIEGAEYTGRSFNGPSAHTHGMSNVEITANDVHSENALNEHQDKVFVRSVQLDNADDPNYASL